MSNNHHYTKDVNKGPVVCYTLLEGSTKNASTMIKKAYFYVAVRLVHTFPKECEMLQANLLVLSGMFIRHQQSLLWFVTLLSNHLFENTADLGTAII